MVKIIYANRKRKAKKLKNLILKNWKQCFNLSKLASTFLNHMIKLHKWKSEI